MASLRPKSSIVKSLILSGVVFCVLTSCASSTKYTTVRSLAYSKMNLNNQIYLKEDGRFVPYLVFKYYQPDTVLLLREQILEQKFQYAEDAIFGSGVSYYANGLIDSYLNQIFIDSLSERLKQNLVFVDLEITSEDTVLRGDNRRNTETIQRKIFLLSATEHGERSSMLTEEGKKIEGLEFYLTSDMDKEWLRSSSLWDDVHAWALSDEFTGTENVTETLGIRPAFVLKANTPIEARNDIIEGSRVYTLSFDT